MQLLTSRFLICYLQKLYLLLLDNFLFLLRIYRCLDLDKTINYIFSRWSVADNNEETEETFDFDVIVDEDGNYTFSFGDWEWSTEDTETDGTDATVNNKVRSYLNLRSGSGMEYEIIGHLLPGEKVQVISEDGDWYQVVIPERTGYVYSTDFTKM